mgnify:CR=1 FL=1
MMRLLIALLLLLYPLKVSAEDVVRYSGTTYQGCSSIGDTTIWLTNPNDYATVKVGFLHAAQGCAAILPSVPDKYRKVESGQVVEMSQAEKDAVDAPAIAAQAAFVVRKTAIKKRFKALGLTDAQVDDAAADATVTVPSVTPLTHTIPLMVVGTAAVWTNQPAALTEMFGSPRRIKADLSPYTEFRLQVNVATAGSSGTTLWVQSSPDQVTWTNLDGAAGPTVAINTTGLKVTPWTAIPVVSQTDIFLRPVAQGGNATADPAFGSVVIQVR